MLRSRRLLLLTAAIATTLGALSGVVHAQESSSQKPAEEGGVPWHLINTAIFAVGLGYALWKFSPAFFNARSADIQKAIKDATGLKLEADFRHSEIDRKMATLPDQVRQMRNQAHADMDREHQLRLEETSRVLKHIDDALQAEIAAVRENGMHQLRQRTATLAMQSVERQLAERDVSEDGHFQDFIHLVEQGRN